MPDSPGERPAGVLHLSARHRAMLEALLQEHLPEVEAWAYGSRVNGQSHDGSDLDLVLRGPDLAEIDASRLADFEEALQNSTIPFLVEARDWACILDSFHREIERNHIVIMSNEEPCGNDWIETKLGNVIELKRGYDLPNSARKAGSVPVVSSSGIIDYHSESKVSGPGVVTGRYGTLGRVFYISGEYWPLNTALYVRDYKGNDPRFINYLLKGVQFSVYSDKAAVPGLNRNHLHQEVIRIPKSVSEQCAIGHILGTLDDKIELNRRMNKTLEAMMQALFKSWFVDFEPVRVKQEGRDTSLPKHLADLFPDRLVDLSSREVPEGWTTSEIGEEVDAVGGATPSTKEPSYWVEGEHHWATPKDLSALHFPILLETDRKITDAGAKRISSGVLPVGTVLLSSRAPIGYLAITEIPTAVNQGFIAMVCNNRLPKMYVLFWCRANLDYIMAIAGGSTFAEISRKSFRTIPVIVPSAAVLAAFDEIVRPLYDRIVANVKESEPLTNAREILCSKLMSREIHVLPSNRR